MKFRFSPVRSFEDAQGNFEQLAPSAVTVAPPDTGDLAGARIKVDHEAPLNVKWPEYGAVGDNSTDNTAAFQAAFDALPHPSGGTNSLGGEIYVPPGMYLCSGPLYIGFTAGIRFRGAAMGGSGTTNLPATQIIYTGPGGDLSSIPGLNGATNLFLCAQSVGGLEITNLAIRYTNAAFTGKLIQIDNQGYWDPNNVLVRDCLIGGRGAYGANPVSIVRAIETKIDNCHIQNGTVGVNGRDVLGSDYCNANQITNCKFDNLTTCAVANFNEGCLVQGCTFEGTSDGSSGGMPAAYRDVGSGVAASAASGCSWIGNWFGDGVVVNDGWIQLGHTTATGGSAILFAGNFFAGGHASILVIGNMDGLTAVGNFFADGGIDLGAGLTHEGVTIVGNCLRDVTNQTPPIANVASVTRDLLIKGNMSKQTNRQTDFLSAPTTAAPGSGTWNTGDVLWNSSPTAGGNIGWVCTAGGSPGTWKTFGAIAA